MRVGGQSRGKSGGGQEGIEDHSGNRCEIEEGMEKVRREGKPGDWDGGSKRGKGDGKRKKGEKRRAEEVGPQIEGAWIFDSSPQ